MRVTAKSKLMVVVLCWMSLGPLPQVIDKISVGFIKAKKDISSGLLKSL